MFQIIQFIGGARKVAQWVRCLLPNPMGLGVIPGSHVVEGEILPLKVVIRVPRSAVVCTPYNRQINRQMTSLK